MNTNTPFPTAAPDFSDPIGLLRACHDNIFQHCTMVVRLAQHLAEKGPDPEATAAAAKIHRYFSTAAKHHHADEEEDLFPRLARQSQEMADTVQRLQQEHRELDTLWQQVEPLLAHPDTIENNTTFSDLAQRFAEAYRAHVQKENEGILEMAQHIFGSDELKQIGRAMAERRGVTLPDTF